MSTINFKSLPISAKRNLGIGVFFALLLALPLAVWSILNLNLNTREKAAVVNIPSYSICGDVCDTNNPCKGSNDQLKCVETGTDGRKQCRNKGCLGRSDCICPATLPNLQVSDIIIVKEKNYGNINCPGYLVMTKITNFGSVAANLLNSKLDISFSPQQRKVTSTNNCNTSVNIASHSFTLATLTNTSALLPGASKNEFFYINPSYTGNLTVTAKVDSNQLIAELNENDNQLVRSFTVTNTAPTTTPTVTPTITATPTVTATPTSTSTSNPTVTPTSAATAIATGTPNYCGGTCGSNYNCQANYFCYQGYCKNPVCPSDSNCDCIANATPTVTPTFRSKTATPKVTATSTATSYSFSGTKTSTPKSTSKVTASGKASLNNDPENKFFVKYALPLFGVFAAIVIFTIIYALKKSSTKDTSIDRISPPTNI